MPKCVHYHPNPEWIHWFTWLLESVLSWLTHIELYLFFFFGLWSIWNKRNVSSDPVLCYLPHEIMCGTRVAQLYPNAWQLSWALESLFYSLTDCFILVRVTVNPEPILGTVGLTRDRPWMWHQSNTGHIAHTYLLTPRTREETGKSRENDWTQSLLTVRWQC